MTLRFSGLMLAVGLVVVGLTACGGTESEETQVIISQTRPPDHLDPALSQERGGWEPMWLVYTPLLTYRHAEGEEGTELIPGLASDLPEISDDGRTYDLRLREELTYSDGTPVVASDFEHAVRRVLYLRSGGSAFFEGILGAREYAAGGHPGADIIGIEADDETGEITIRLTTPDATFANVLAMDFAGLVPASTPFEDLSAAPPPGVGPYEIASSTPKREFVLERSENFPPLDIPDIPIGTIDRIITRIIPSERRQAQDVLDNKLDYMHDSPPPQMVPVIFEQAADRFKEHATVSTYYFFLNAQRPPFDDPLVREAVNSGLDRGALAQIYGGTLEPGCAFLAPGMPGYDEDLDRSDCPYGDPAREPDLETARALIEQADAKGEKVTVWGSTALTTRGATRTYARMLDRIGLDAKLRLVDASRYYATIELRATRAQTGFTNWFQDFPHPLNFFVTVDGDSIQQRNNPNPGNIDDPLVNATVDRLRTESDPDDVATEAAELDRYLVSPPQSYVAPFGHRKLATFFSERMEPQSAIFHPVYGNDYSSWTLKEGE